MMTGRERVTAALTFANPDRPPRDLWALPFGSPEDVYAAVHRVRRALDDGTGGVIAQCEWGKDNSPANVSAVFEAWLEPVHVPIV